MPAFREGAGFRLAPGGDGYWRLLAAVDATEVPRRDFVRFAWEDLWGFGTTGIRARRACRSVTTASTRIMSIAVGTRGGASSPPFDPAAVVRRNVAAMAASDAESIGFGA